MSSLARWNRLARLVDEYDDELRDAAYFGYSAHEWFQVECKERHSTAAHAWAETFDMPVEEAYRQFAMAVAKYNEEGSMDKVRVSSEGFVRGLRLVWSGCSDYSGNHEGLGVEVPDWVWEKYPKATTSGTAHLVYVWVEEEEK